MYCTCFHSTNSIKDGCGNTDAGVLKLDMMGEGCIWLGCSQSCESLNIIYQLNFLCFSLSPGTHDDVIMKVFTARKLRCWRHVHRLYSLCLQLNRVPKNTVNIMTLKGTMDLTMSHTVFPVMMFFSRWA